MIHKTSGVVVYASTQENAINKKLYSTIDVSAAENIGRILAHRCHCIGIISVLFDVVETPLKSTRNKAFHDALLESGIELEEPSVPRPENYGIDYDSLSFEQKKSLYPSLIEELRTTPDWGNNKYPYSLRPVAGSAKNKMKYQVRSSPFSHLFIHVFSGLNCHLNISSRSCLKFARDIFGIGSTIEWLNQNIWLLGKWNSNRFRRKLLVVIPKLYLNPTNRQSPMYLISGDWIS